MNSGQAGDPLTVIFAHLDRWRHLPAYQLERRADIFFSVYLPDLIAEHKGLEVSRGVIPELPIRRDLIWPERPTKASVKVDYAVLARDRSRVYFVELKTDTASRRDAQDAYLQRAVGVGFRRVVEGIVEISQATSACQKYGHLLSALAQHECLRLPDGLEHHLWPEVRPGLGRVLQEIEVTVGSQEFEIEVVYVQPEAVGDDCIGFEQVAAHVERRSDPVSQAFALHLRRWTAVAGAERP